MYYKIKNDVLFRKYQGHGYIADNSEYGYRMLDDNVDVWVRNMFLPVGLSC